MIRAINHNLTSLSQKSTPASLSDRPTGQDLLDTLAAHHDNCLGMAANMINVHKRIIAVRLGPVDVVMFNPQIIYQAQPYQTKEGCLSLTGQRKVRRYAKISLTYRDRQWRPQHIVLSQLAAEIVQHEIDHCNGVLI